MVNNDFELFKERKIKASEIFYIAQIPKQSAYNFVRKYHYLGDATFFSMYQFGLFYKPTTELVGVATFSVPQGGCALAGWFNLPNDTTNIFELSRLCLLPELNNTNASSYLLGGSIKQFNKMNEDVRKTLHKEHKQMSADDYVCRAVITLADASRHVGSIYQVCNFDYYGVTDEKSDFWREDGEKNPRHGSSPQESHGVWLPRSQKHRYAYILDKSLKCLYTKEIKPSTDSLIFKKSCCHGTNIVYDKRFGEYWTCPLCTGKIELVDKDGNKLNNPRVTGVAVKEKKKENSHFERVVWDI